MCLPATAIPDYYGAQRTPEAEKYSSSVVALDAMTGDVRWSFQTVHHDLWDYDVGAQPVLVDIPTEQGTVPALIQGTKTGQVFLLDRRDGHPLAQVAEKPVPQGGRPRRLDREDATVLGRHARVHRARSHGKGHVGRDTRRLALVPDQVPRGAL